MTKAVAVFRSVVNVGTLLGPPANGTRKAEPSTEEAEAL
jgi:hypothetical protein